MKRPATKTLAELAAEAGFSSQAQLCDFTGLTTTVVSNAWPENDWLRRMTGTNLAQLIEAVPAVQDYSNSLVERALSSKLRQVRSTLEISDAALAGLRTDIPDQYLIAVCKLLQLLTRAESDEELLKKVTPFLANFWQRDRGRALGAVLAPADTTAIRIGPAIERAIRLFDLLTNSKAQSGPPGARQQSRQVLAHYLTLRGEITPDDSPSHRATSRLLDYRCGVMAAITKSNDFELALRYRYDVRHNEKLQATERWMFPAWTGDCSQKSTPAVPFRGPLIATGAEILLEVSNPKYSSAYIWYLCTTYLPLALQQDRTLGLHASDVQLALKERLLDNDTSHETQAAIERIDARLSEE